MRPMMLVLAALALPAAELEATKLGNWAVVYWYDTIAHEGEVSTRYKRVTMLTNLEMVKIGRREYLHGTVPPVRGIESHMQGAQVFIDHNQVFSMVLARDGQSWAEFFKTGVGIEYWSTIQDEAQMLQERYPASPED
ncbi:MAG: hypothetical protein ACOCXA_05870 [Planctomycetota bacterium]